MAPQSVVNDLKWWEERYVALTAKLGDVARQLAFAGIAGIWVVGNVESSGPELPPTLVLAAFLFLLGLATDLIHAVVAVMDAEHVATKLREGDRSVLNPERFSVWLRFLDKAPRVLFWCKLVAIGTGYLPLLSHVARVLSIR